jgi:hypothetical protein
MTPDAWMATWGWASPCYLCACQDARNPFESPRPELTSACYGATSTTVPVNVPVVPTPRGDSTRVSPEAQYA